MDEPRITEYEQYEEKEFWQPETPTNEGKWAFVLGGASVVLMLFLLWQGVEAIVSLAHH